jgi:RNA polymerase sigma-70 factor (ECF subfamily)
VFPRADPHHWEEAAGDTLCDYVKNPATYRPELLNLTAYLRMAAKRDLLNLCKKEHRHHEHRVAMSLVEFANERGNLSGENDNPVDRLEREEEAMRANDLLQALVQDFTPEERRVAELMRDGQRQTQVFAEAIGQGHLPVEEQKREVKRVKDRIKKRLERGGTGHG